MSRLAASAFNNILLFDTTKTESTTVVLISDQQSDVISRNVRAQQLQLMIKEILEKNSLKPSDIDLIAVIRGQGSFTGTRIGVTTANVWAWLNDRKIVGEEGADLGKIIAKLKSGHINSDSKFVKAIY